MLDIKNTKLQPWLHRTYSQFWSSHVTLGSEATFAQTIGIDDRFASGAVPFAVTLAHALLCDQPTTDGFACGHCGQCKLLLAGNHTDLMILAPETHQPAFVSEKDKKPSKEIKIEQVREIETQFFLSSQRGGRKVVIVYPAQALGHVAANALLKTLEEPSPNTFFLLVSAQWQQVLPTIRSRCVSITLPGASLTEKTDALNALNIAHPNRWLEIAAGRLDKARLMANDPLWLPLLRNAVQLGQGARCQVLELSSIFSKSELPRVTELLILWMTDLLSVHLGAKALFFNTQTPQLEYLSQYLMPEQAAQYLNDLMHLHTISTHPLNPRAQSEALLFKYVNLFQNQP